MANVKVSPIGLLDMLKFKNVPKTRAAMIDRTPIDLNVSEYGANRLAAILHPEKQKVIIKEMRQNGPDARTLVLQSADGGRLAPFRAGQYVSVVVEAAGTVTTRSYSLCGSPAWAKDGIYNITVKRDDSGFVSPFIQDNWKVGQEITISGPQGHLFYEPIRDCRRVIGLAGGSGITPFMAMAYAIRDGVEDFDLTIMLGSRTADAIIYEKELKELSACDRIHVVHVLSDEEKPGYEHGFLSADLIAKYAGGDEVSVFMCGPQAMYSFLDGELAKLGLDRKHVRRELFGAIKDPWNQPGYPAGAKDRVFRLKVICRGEEVEIPAAANESLLTAMERGGVKAPARCRSGECGWCRSRLIDGRVFIPEVTDGRRYADVQFSYVHPCSTFPVGDVVLEVPGQYLK